MAEELSVTPASVSRLSTLSNSGLLSKPVWVDLGLQVNPDIRGCVWTDEFDFNTLLVDGEIFESGKRVAD